jgi:hypothetical protein
MVITEQEARANENAVDMTITEQEAEANERGTLKCPTGQTCLDNPLGTDDVRVVIARFIQMMTGISGSLAFAVFVWGGFNWVIAAGDENRIKTGKNAFKYGAYGLIVIFGSYVAVRALFTLLGQAGTK